MVAGESISSVITASKQQPNAHNPAHIAETSLCPDIVIMSEASRQIALIELMVPWRLHRGHLEGSWPNARVFWKSVGGLANMPCGLASMPCGSRLQRRHRPVSPQSVHTAKLPGACGLRGVIHGQMLLQLGHDQPRLGHLGEGVRCCKILTPNEPRIHH